MYRFLTAEVKAYLSSFETMTIFHLKDLVRKRRKIIKCDDVKVIAIPQFEGLSIEDMLGFAKAHNDGEAMMVLPELSRE